MAFKLRPYQQEAVDNIKADWEKFDNLLLVMATGLGKTAVFLSILHDLLGENKRALIIAHRKELIDQPKDKLISYYPEWDGKIGIVMADQNECDKQIIIATIQTISRSDKRLKEIFEFGPIDYIITDEAHHAVADTYINTYKILKEMNPNIKHLGVTATPFRADKAGLVEVFEHVSGKYGIVEGIKLHYLTPVRWLAIATKINLEGIKITKGDFAVGELAERFCTDQNFDLVVATHKKYGSDRQGIAFVPLVENAYTLASKFNDAGIPAVAADGTTKKKDREKILDDFIRGKYKVLCNVGLYTEGLDVPSASLIHQVRPTRSDGLYTQMVGRALRIFPGKEDALVLDYAPEDDRNITMMGDILGKSLRRDAVMKKETVAGEPMGGLTFDGEFNWMEGSPVEIISRQLDYLDYTPFSWFKGDQGWMSLGLGTADDGIERILMISPPTHGAMKMFLVAKRFEEKNWNAYEIKQSNDFDELRAWADDYCDKRGDSALAVKKRAWRQMPPTEGQQKFARYLRIPDNIVYGENRGYLAQYISHKLAQRAVNKIYTNGG